MFSAYIIATSAGTRKIIARETGSIKPGFYQSMAIGFLAGPSMGATKKEAIAGLDTPRPYINGLTMRELARQLHRRWAKTAPVLGTAPTVRLTYQSSGGEIREPEAKIEPLPPNIDLGNLDF